MKDTGISPLVLEEIRTTAKQNGLAKVILFGSRARGDYKKTSDIDLAISGGNTALFAAEMEETSTLLSFDIVDMDKPVQEELLQSIAKEGCVLYEKI